MIGRRKGVPTEQNWFREPRFFSRAILALRIMWVLPAPDSPEACRGHVWGGTAGGSRGRRLGHPNHKNMASKVTPAQSDPQERKGVPQKCTDAWITQRISIRISQWASGSTAGAPAGSTSGSTNGNNNGGPSRGNEWGRQRDHQRGPLGGPLMGAIGGTSTGDHLGFPEMSPWLWSLALVFPPAANAMEFSMIFLARTWLSDPPGPCQSAPVVLPLCSRLCSRCAPIQCQRPW